MEFKHVSFHLTPENTTGVGPTEILEMEKGIWKCFEPKTKIDIRSIDALSMDAVIPETHIKQMREREPLKLFNEGFIYPGPTLQIS